MKQLMNKIVPQLPLKNVLLKSVSVLVAGLSLSTSVLAGSIAITGATVHTMDSQGKVENGTVLIKDGVIESITAGADAPKGYSTIDAKGKVITPGIIAPRSALGMVEVSMSAGLNDSNVAIKQPDSTIGASMDSQYAINMHSSLINITRVDGVTTAATGINYGNALYQGMGSIISLGDKISPVMKSKAYMAVNLSGLMLESFDGSRAVTWPKFLRTLDEAASLNGRKLKSNQEWHGEFSKADLNALIPVLAGDMPLFVTAIRASDIRQVIALKSDYSKLDLVLVHGSEAWMVADELANAGIPVIVNPESNLPFDFDELAATLQNAVRLAAAGVQLSIGNTSKYGADTHNIRLVTQLAGNAVANGLPWETAIAALTINNAKLFDMEDQIGSLAPGKKADLVIWTGDPLEVMNYAEVVIINGDMIPMESRQTKLRDRYMELQNDKPYRYTKP